MSERPTQAEIDYEYQLLRAVYESARSLLRFNGVDKERTTKAADDLDEAIEYVKQFDGGNFEIQEANSTHAQEVEEQEWREQFELGIKSINFPLTRKGEGYRSSYTDNMWLAYQHGRRDEAKLREKDAETIAELQTINQTNAEVETLQNKRIKQLEYDIETWNIRVIERLNEEIERNAIDCDAALVQKNLDLQATIAQKDAEIEKLTAWQNDMRSVLDETTNIQSELYSIKQREAELIEALNILARLGNGDQLGNSIGNKIAQEAIAANKLRGNHG